MRESVVFCGFVLFVSFILAVRDHHKKGRASDALISWLLGTVALAFAYGAVYISSDLGLFFKFILRLFAGLWGVGAICGIGWSLIESVRNIEKTLDT